MALNRHLPQVIRALGERPGARMLLVTDPEDRCSYYENDQKQNGPRVDTAVAFSGFGRVAHCIASCRFYR